MEIKSYENDINSAFHFGIGVFVYLSLSGISYFLSEWLENLLIITPLHPLFIYWGTKTIILILFIAGSYLSLKGLTQWRLRRTNSRKAFGIIFLTYWGIQLLLFVNELTLSPIFFQSFSEELLKYLDSIEEILYFRLIPSIFSMLKVVAFGLLIFRAPKFLRKFIPSNIVS